MPNTPQEDQLVKNAMNELSSLYGEYMLGNPFALGVVGCPSGRLFNWVHFLDDGPFRKNLLLSGKIPDGCQVRGSTDRQGTRFAKDHSVVWINRSAATASTVLHELLHALSDNSWYMWAYSKKPWLNEGVTEYLTRRVTKKTDDEVFQEDRSGTYEGERQLEADEDDGEAGVQYAHGPRRPPPGAAATARPGPDVPEG